MPKKYNNPPSLPNWSQSFSQVLVTTGVTRTVYISGQVSVDREKKLIGAGDLGTQARTAFGNLLKALEAGGATVHDVVRLGIYVVGYQPEHAAIIGEAMREHFGKEALPTSTWLGVQSLALEGLLIEVEAVALIE